MFLAGREKTSCGMSSVSAATWYLFPDDYVERIAFLKKYVFDEV